MKSIKEVVKISFEWSTRKVQILSFQKKSFKLLVVFNSPMFCMICHFPVLFDASVHDVVSVNKLTNTKLLLELGK